MSFILQDRPFQDSIIEETRTHMKKGIHSVLIQSPTGSGKTVLTARMLKAAAAKGMTAWFICHRVELIRQCIQTFGDVGINHGIIASGFNQDHRHKIQVASIQTLARRFQKLKKPNLICWDEVHHICANTYKKIYHSFSDSYHIGLSGTPARLDGQGLSDYFKKMVHGPSVDWLIKNKYLSPYKLFAPSSINTSGVHTRAGDFAKDELAKACDKPTIVGNAVREYKKRAMGKRAIARGVSVEHSKHIAAQFNAEGIPSLHVDGDTPSDERMRAMESFRRGNTLVLTNVDLFSEGVDVPSVECILDLRPTQSLTLWLQFCGRSLRVSPGKEYALILDFAGNAMRHGLPCEEREWTLEGHDAGRKKSEDCGSVRICSSCFAAQRPGRPACQFCGFVFQIKQREVAHVDGDLKEIDLDQLRKIKHREQGQCQSLDDLVALGKKRKMRFPHRWAHYVFQARQRRKVFA